MVAYKAGKRLWSTAQVNKKVDNEEIIEVSD